MKNFFKTFGAFLLCVLMVLFSGKIFNFLPGFLKIIAITSYYYGGMYFYTAISSNGGVSIAFGVVASVLFALYYLFSIFYDIGWFNRIFYIIGLITGVGSTLSFLTYKSKYMRGEKERG